MRRFRCTRRTDKNRRSSWYKKEGDKVVAVPGRLLYRELKLKILLPGFKKDQRHGFDETVFLLLTGHLPDKEKLKEFSELLASLRDLLMILRKT